MKGISEFFLNDFVSAKDTFNKVLARDSSSQSALYYKGKIDSGATIITKGSGVQNLTKADFELKSGISLSDKVFTFLSSSSLPISGNQVEFYSGSYKSKESKDKAFSLLKSIVKSSKDGDKVTYVSNAKQTYIGINNSIEKTHVLLNVQSVGTGSYIIVSFSKDK
jgi:hypothetical protein